MKVDMIFSGFGGQGALTAGRFVAQAAMTEGKEVSWFPSYGPEMRGGTANVFVIVSDKPIASPLVSAPNLLVAFNQPSLDKFGPIVAKGGLIIVNSDMCPHIDKRDGIEYIVAPLNKMAQDIGDSKILNMISLGVIIKKLGLFSLESAEKALKEAMGEGKKAALLEMNIKAIKAGMEL